jgi:CheY-like chemotaxis protein
MQTTTIVLADDDPEDQFIIQEAMESLNAREVLCFADNGEDVWKVLEEKYKDKVVPCLIVLDLNMPKMSGSQTLARIKSDERFKDIPVIIYSTSINPVEKERCLFLGAHSYITKPVSFNESIETAKTFLQFC